MCYCFSEANLIDTYVSSLKGKRVGYTKQSTPVKHINVVINCRQHDTAWFLVLAIREKIDLKVHHWFGTGCFKWFR